MRLRISVSAGVIFLALLTPLRAETVRTTSRLNLRQEPSTESARIELLPLGRELEVISRRGLWLEVRVGGSEGWVHSDYVAGSAGAVGTPGRQADPARATLDAELARDVALLRVRQLEEELATLRGSSAARIEELEARLAEWVDGSAISSGSGVSSDADGRAGATSGEHEASRSQPVVVWQVAPSEPLAGAAGPSPDDGAGGARTRAPASRGAQTSLVEVAAPLFRSPPAERSDAEIGLEAIEAVRRWAAAWSRQDVAGYLAAYDSDFEPASGVDRGSWITQQQVMISSPSFIEVVVSDLDVSVVAPDRVAVEFEQAYRSNSFSDRVRKTLELARRSGSWKIVREEWN